MRYQLLHTVGMYSICRSCKIGFYLVLLSAVGGEILLLPVRFRICGHGCLHCFFTVLQWITFKAIIFQRYTRVS